MDHTGSIARPLASPTEIGRRGRAVRSGFVRLVGYAFLTAGSAVMALPFFWLLSTSLTARGLEFQVPPQWIPNPIEWGNYHEAIFESGLPFPTFIVNTTIITILNVIGTLISASIAGFGFARLRFPGRDALFVLVLSTMMLPGIVTLIPTYLLYKTIGFVDTWLPLIVPAFLGGGAFYVFLFRQFFLGLPVELDEAARCDGASTWQIYARIALPLSGPVLATVGIFTFLNSWNNFLDALIYLNSIEKMTLAVGLQAFKGVRVSDWNLMMAAATVMIVPVVVLFFAAQRYFVKGIVMTGLSGR
jgi:ABC-type glycerol-3-phosphate transport system permease component